MRAFLALLISTQLWANANFNPTRVIQLEGENCSELQAHSDAIRNWSLHKSPALTLPQTKCYCSEDDCHMDVLPISPSFVKEYTKFRGSYQSIQAFQGANCFNAAFLSTKTVEFPYFTHPAEVRAILSSSFCTERSLTEELQPGDIFVVRNDTLEYPEIHAGIYISPTLSFNKYGESHMMPYSFGFNAINTYKVKIKECERVVGTPQKGSPCFEKYYANYYSCIPNYQFVSQLINTPEGLDEDLRIIYANTSSLESRISRIAMKGGDISEKDLKTIQQNLKKLNRSAKRIRNLSADQMSFANILRYKTLSLFEQSRRIAGGKGYKKLTGIMLNP